MHPVVSRPRSPGARGRGSAKARPPSPSGSVVPARASSDSAPGVVIFRPAGAEAGSADGAEAPPTGRKGEGPPRRRWVTLLIVALALLAGALAFLPHRHAWVGHNGDHYYYASTALQYAGAGYEESLRIATDYFHYPYPATQLDLGYLNPAVAPLIYPRVVLGVLAWPAVDLAGVEGVWFPGLLCGALSVALLMVLAVRRVGRAGMLMLPLLIGATRYAPEFMFGIYAEAPVILATTLMLLAFPLGDARRRWPHALAAAGLVPLMMLSRQVPLLPIGMVLGGWVWAWIGSRRFRNPWLPFAVTVLPATVISYWLLSVWAPYNALPYLYSMTGATTLDELLKALPDMWSVSIGTDWNDLVTNDSTMLLVSALGLTGFLLVLRNPLAGVFLGTLGSGLATELLNGQANAFRYFAPCLPVLLLLAVLFVSWAAHGLIRRLGGYVPDWPGVFLARGQARRRPGVVHVLPDGRMRISRDLDPGLLPTRWGPAAAAAASWLAVAGVIAGAIAAHPQAPVSVGREETISASTFAAGSLGKGKPWPLTVSEGTLSCAGDDFQMWFVTPDGVRYALSGTAMASSPRTRRILDLAPGGIAYAWPEIKPLLSEGMRLCGSSRGYQRDPVSQRTRPGGV